MRSAIERRERLPCLLSTTIAYHWDPIACIRLPSGTREVFDVGSSTYWIDRHDDGSYRVWLNWVEHDAHSMNHDGYKHVVRIAPDLKPKLKEARHGQPQDEHVSAQVVSL